MATRNGALIAEIREAIGGHTGDVRAVANYLGVRPQAVRDLCWRGEIPFMQVKPGVRGSTMRIRASAVAAWIEQNERRPAIEWTGIER